MTAMRSEEQRCGRAVDLVLATSERDRRVFEEELALPRVAVILNGIDSSKSSSRARRRRRRERSCSPG